MTRRIGLHLILLAFSALKLVGSDNINKYKQLQNSLLGNYSNKIRPFYDQDEKIDIYVSFYLSSIIEVDTVGQRMVKAAHLRVKWVDQFLKWDGNSTGIQELHFKQDDIWIPDLDLVNGIQTVEEMGDAFYYVIVTPDGTVTWNPYNVFETKCEIDTTYFPFDTQTCKLSFISRTFSKEKVNKTLQNQNIPINYHFYIVNPVWEIRDATSQSSVEDSSTLVTFSLVLRRQSKFYVLNLILSIILLGVMSLLEFVIPAEAEEKMSFVVTVFLSFTVFLAIISTHIPVDSENTSILEIFLNIQMSLGILRIIVSSFQLWLHHRKSHKNIGAFYRGVMCVELFLRCSTCSDSSSRATNDTLDDVNWSDVSSAIDFFCFWVILVLQLVVVMVLFVSYIMTVNLSWKT